jgi:fibro-slime domain-containing protein
LLRPQFIGFALLGCAIAASAYFGPRLVRARSSATPGTSLPIVTDDALAESMVLSAIIRDFKGGSHPDFQAFMSPHATVGLVEDRLASNGLPRARGLSGKRIGTDWTNASGVPINPALFSLARGDKAGTYDSLSNQMFSSVESFHQWYVSVPGVNASTRLDMVLKLDPATKRYVFDSAEHEPWKGRGGFFPINGELLGNYDTTGKNFHFTTQIEADFVYRKDRNDVFTFTGDDDVWVFIDDRLVIDLGGLHPRRTQTLELARLDWLENGKVYRFKIFHAERRTTQSNFRMETTIQFRQVEPPEVTKPFD